MHCKNIRIHYKLAVMAYKVLQGRAPSYLGPLVRVADVSGRGALRSAGTNRILVPPVTSTTVGSRAFAVAAPLIWNSLPDDVISAESLPMFQRKLKRHLFCQAFLGFCYWHLHLHLQWTLQWQCHLGHSRKLWLIDWLIDLPTLQDFLPMPEVVMRSPGGTTVSWVYGHSHVSDGLRVARRSTVIQVTSAQSGSCSDTTTESGSRSASVT